MRITFGGSLTVSAEERWFTEIRAGRAFTFGRDQGPTVANFSHVQLFNPVGSGITVITHKILTSRSPAGLLFYRAHNAPLAGLIGNGNNLLMGGAASVAEVRSEDNAGILGTFVNSVLVLASSPLSWVNWGFELGAGEGVLVMPALVNERILANYEWVEV